MLCWSEHYLLKTGAACRLAFTCVQKSSHPTIAMRWWQIIKVELICRNKRCLSHVVVGVDTCCTAAKHCERLSPYHTVLNHCERFKNLWLSSFFRVCEHVIIRKTVKKNKLLPLNKGLVHFQSFLINQMAANRVILLFAVACWTMHIGTSYVSTDWWWMII